MAEQRGRVSIERFRVWRSQGTQLRAAGSEVCGVLTARYQPDEDSLAELVVRCQQGDKLAFDRLMSILRPHIRSALFRFGARRDGDDGEEAIGEVMFQVYRTIGTFKGNNTIREWVVGVCRNVCRLREREWRRWQRLLERLEEDAVGAQEASSSTAEDLSSARELCEAALQLPDRYRHVFTLYYVEGFTCWEISGLLHIPQGTVKSRLYEVRHRLTSMTSPEGEPR
jgi:RNA polymerase sigma-70 factor (ECF subfamily)